MCIYITVDGSIPTFRVLGSLVFPFKAMASEITIEQLNNLNAAIRKASIVDDQSQAFRINISRLTHASAAVKSSYEHSIADLSETNARTIEKLKELMGSIVHMFQLYQFSESRLRDIDRIHWEQLSSSLTRKAQDVQREHGSASTTRDRLSQVMTGEWNDFNNYEKTERAEAGKAGKNAEIAETNAKNKENAASNADRLAKEAKRNAELEEAQMNRAEGKLEDKEGSGLLKAIGAGLIVASTPLHGGAGLAVFAGGVGAAAAGLGSSGKSDLKDEIKYHRNRANDFRRNQSAHESNITSYTNEAKDFRNQQRQHRNNEKEHQDKADGWESLTNALQRQIDAATGLNNVYRGFGLEFQAACFAMATIEKEMVRLQYDQSILQSHYAIMRSKVVEITNSCNEYWRSR
jgi:hypothetical protein